LELPPKFLYFYCTPFPEEIQALSEKKRGGFKQVLYFSMIPAKADRSICAFSTNPKNQTKTSFFLFSFF